MKPTLFGSIVGKFKGPILVIGGGPSAPESLASLREEGFEPAAVLSANVHGFKQPFYKVTHTVVCDPFHGETKQNMEAVLRAAGPGVPIITRLHFGDYRLPEHRLALNAGFEAVVAAVFMGGSPVVTVGIDCYNVGNPGAGTYFHDADAISNSTTKNERNFRQQIDVVNGATDGGQTIRPFGGWLTKFWPQYGRHPVGLELPLPRRALWHAGLAVHYAKFRPAGKPIMFDLGRAEYGRIIPVSKAELIEVTTNHRAKDWTQMVLEQGWKD